MNSVHSRDSVLRAPIINTPFYSVYPNATFQAFGILCCLLVPAVRKKLWIAQFLGVF